MLNTLLKYLVFCLLLLLMNNRLQGQSNYANLMELSVAEALDSTSFITATIQSDLTYNPERDAKRLLINTGVNVGMSLVKFGVLWVSPESFSNWDKDAIRDKGWYQSWKDNVKAGPVKDDDGFLLNGIMHPWGGAMYYMSARGSGYRWWESFVYSGLLSTFMWEYGLEAFAEVPSWQDLIITPVVGSVVGECFYVFKGKIIRNDKRVLNSRFLGVSTLIVMDPVNELTNVLGYKTKHKIEASSAIVPINTFAYNAQTVMGVQVKIRF